MVTDVRSTFIFGIVAGVASAVALAWFAPFVHQERVRSQTQVQTNGGRLERFEIRMATDILTSVPGADNADDGPLPATADWYPELAPFSGQASVYRVRNESGVVIGMASRIRGVQASDDVEWVINLPARGTLALSGISVDVAEVGSVVSGTREFSDLTGTWEARLDEDNIWRMDTVVRMRPGDDE